MKGFKEKKTDFLFTGFALFAMFFGAGNLIFPPELGVMSGADWWIGFLGFFVMDAGLATLGVFTMMNCNGSLEEVTAPLGSFFGKCVAIIVVLCLGPCIAVPRTGTVTFSVGLMPIVGVEEGGFALAIFSIIFFSILFVLSIRENKVVGIIGKVLTPLLLVCLLILIVKGVAASEQNFATGGNINPVKEGIVNGYQTMDAMASLVFAGIIIASVYDGGYERGKTANRQIAKSSVLSCALLFTVYGGLTYLGATHGGNFMSLLTSGSIDQAQLLINIVREIMGASGVLIISLIVIFACLTTGIGLISAIAEFLTKLSGNRISYSRFVALICIVGALLCNVGLNQIVSLAVPILSLAYPVVIVLIALGLFKDKIKTRIPYISGAIVAFVMSFFDFLSNRLSISMLALFKDDIGIKWAIPTVMVIGITLLIERKLLNK